MYAVIADRGKQYFVHEGERLRLDLIDKPVGSKVVFDRVLLVGGESGVQTGKPLVGGARVEAVVLGETKGPKLIVFHKRRRKYMRRKNGHRQHFTDVRVEKIG